MARIKQLDERTIAETRAASELERSRLGNKAYFDDVKRLRPEHQQLHLGDLVLMVNAMKERSTGSRYKLDDNWFGSYRIREVSDTGFYRLEELDGTRLTPTFAGNRLKRFFTRQFREQAVVPELESEEEDEEVDEEVDVEVDVDRVFRSPC
jgi:hypothetical protein